MNELLDKISLLIFSIALYALTIHHSLMIIPIIIAITLSALNSYISFEPFRLFSFFSFIALCFLNPSYIVFLPFIGYDLYSYKIKWLWLIALIPIAVNISTNPVLESVLTLIFFLVAFITQKRTNTLIKAKDEYIALRDSAKELNLKLENKNKELIEKQDFEITVATLNERTRIARDIHDNVGHLLSSAILQIGAILATSQEPTTKEGLQTIKQTLSKGMDSIRSSIHNMHNEALDLQIEIKALTDDFTFCPIQLEYDIVSNPPIKLKYCFLFVIKEALANIMKHSSATQVFIKTLEHPALYQLIIKDNGTNIKENDDGIGLKNISERVNGLNGYMNIDKSKGFTIFISVPKNNE